MARVLVKLSPVKVAILKDIKPAGTTGGTSSASFVTRVLNTLEGDTDFISLNSNQFTLQPGIYRIWAAAPVTRQGFFAPHAHKAKLRNITAGTDVVIGTSGKLEVSQTGQGNGAPSVIMGYFTIIVQSDFEIQHRMSVASTNGWGWPAGFGVSEVYTQVEISKVA